MGIFSNLFSRKEPDKKAEPAAQPVQAQNAGGPYIGWPWVLTINGMPRSQCTWEDIDLALRELEADPDSFLILEQKDPADPKRYWYLQCAIATQGPSQGYYTVGCGFSGPDGSKESRKYYERSLPWVGDVTPIFQSVWQGQSLDLTPFTDTSDMLF